MLLAFGCAALISPLFAAVLLAYFVLTLAYSFTLKRRLIVDIVVLATLYTTRVIAGAAALPVVPSEWLLAFSMFIFTCLALVKRYVELAMRLDRELPDPSNRNYRLDRPADHWRSCRSEWIQRRYDLCSIRFVARGRRNV